MPGNSLLVPARIVPESKPWWSKACQTAFDNYSVSREKEDWSAFRRAVREAKRDFFAERIQEVAVTQYAPVGPDGVGQTAQEPPVARQSRGMVSLVMTLNSCGMLSIAPTTLLRAVNATCPC